MGLFSSREKTTVGTSISRVIEDSRITESSKIAVIKSIVKNGDMSDYLIEGMSSSMGTRAERMYDFAKTGYTFGLPSGEFYAATQGSEQIKAILDSMTGRDVILDYTRLGPANTLHMGWMKLISDYGYNSETNELTGLSATRGYPVYLKNMTVVIPRSKIGTMDPKALEQWGEAPSAGHIPFAFGSDLFVSHLVEHSPLALSDTAPSEQVLVEFAWQEYQTSYDDFVDETLEKENLLSDTFIIPITDFDDNADYFHAKYTIDNKAYYWMYALNSGTYPPLDALFNAPPTLVGEFYPFAYFRLNKTPMDVNVNAASYLTSKKMVKYLGLDYDQLISSIHENPNIDDVEQAMMVLAVPANTTHPLEQQYLYDFFDRLRLNQDNTYGLYNLRSILAQFMGWERDITAAAVVIQDQAFKMSLSNSGIYKRRVGGSIGARGTYSSGYGENKDRFKVNGGDNGFYDQEITITSHYYRKQVSDTMYDEIEVINLRTTYYVYDEFKSIGDGTKDILIVPIDRTLTERYSIPMKEALYSRALHYVFNSRVITHVAWYQEAWFSALVLAIAFAIAIFTAGQSLVAYSAALAAGTITIQAILWSIAVSLMESILISMALAYVVKQVGPEVGIALALLAAAYGLAGDGLSATTSLPFADKMLAVSTGLINSSGNEYAANIQQIQTEFSDLYAEAERVSVLINKAQDLLETNSMLSPLTIIGESSDDYYRRTMYSGNVGVYALSGVSSYVERALTLPTLADSFGDVLNQSA